MDTSDQASKIALEHALNGVNASELQPRERLEFLRRALRQLTEWPNGLPPGFDRYGRRLGNMSVNYVYPVSDNSLVLPLVKVPVSATSTVTLVFVYHGVTRAQAASGLYLETGSCTESSYVMNISRASDEVVMGLLSLSTFGSALSAITKCIARRQRRIKDESDFADSHQAFIGRVNVK